MTTFNDFATAGLRAAIATFGTAFTFNAQNFSGVQSDEISTMPLEAGGFLADYAFTLHCVKADFDPLPEIGQELTLDTVVYRIARITTSDGDPAIAFDCTTPNK